MLAFIDQIVIPFLNILYGAVGYVGGGVAMAIESAMIPLPSELVLPYAGFLISDPTQLEPMTRARWDFWIVVIVATLGNTVGSLIGYAIGAWGGRPFLERCGRYLLIRPHEIELAEPFFRKYGPATAFFSRLLPIVRTFISFPAGVARMPLGKFILYSTLGAIPWSIVLVFAGIQLGGHWLDIRHALQPFDLRSRSSPWSLVAAVHLVAAGMPGRRRAVTGRAAARAAARRQDPRGARRAPERAPESHVVHDLQATGDEERQRGEARHGEERRCDQRRERGAGRPRDSRDAGGGGPLVRRRRRPSCSSGASARPSG